jgi:hypothetical protein
MEVTMDDSPLKPLENPFGEDPLKDPFGPLKNPMDEKDPMEPLADPFGSMEEFLEPLEEIKAPLEPPLDENPFSTEHLLDLLEDSIERGSLPIGEHTGEGIDPEASELEPLLDECEKSIEGGDAIEPLSLLDEGQEEPEHPEAKRERIPVWPYEPERNPREELGQSGFYAPPKGASKWVRGGSGAGIRNIPPDTRPCPKNDGDEVEWTECIACDMHDACREEEQEEPEGNEDGEGFSAEDK